MIISYRSVTFLGAALMAAMGLIAGPGWGQKPATEAARPKTEPARELLIMALTHYQKLDAFSATIRHQDSSGLFPGAYTPDLRWRKGGRFALTVTSPVEMRVPDYYADGKRVVTDTPQKKRFINDIIPEPNTSPGWEVTGGPILSSLQRTDFVNFLQGKRPPYAAFQFGPRTEWQGHKVREIVTVWTKTSEGGPPVSFFVDPAGTAYYGMEWMPDRAKTKTGFMVYDNQKFNPNLSVALGNPPPATPPHVVEAQLLPTTDRTKRKPETAPRPPLLADGTIAPEFTVEDKNGKSVKLSDYAGRVVVIDFWATWCDPCQRSLPHTNTVAGKFRDNAIFLAVNTWDEKGAFDKWLGENQTKYANLSFAFDPHGRKGDVAKTLYSVPGIPTQYVIGRDGKIVKGILGFDGENSELSYAIEKALAAPAPDSADKTPPAP